VTGHSPSLCRARNHHFRCRVLSVKHFINIEHETRRETFVFCECELWRGEGREDEKLCGGEEGKVKEEKNSARFFILILLLLYSSSFQSFCTRCVRFSTLLKTPRFLLLTFIIFFRHVVYCDSFFFLPSKSDYVIGMTI
jgi:hypothetical protein